MLSYLFKNWLVTNLSYKCDHKERTMLETIIVFNFADTTTTTTASAAAAAAAAAATTTTTTTTTMTIEW